MSLLARALTVALLVAGGGLAGCGGDDDADPVAADAPVTTAERALTVCGVEQQVDRINDGTSAGGDFANQRAKAVEYLDAILAVRAQGRPPADIAAEYAAVTEAYEVVRDSFDVASTPEAYLAEVQRLATEKFGTAEEVDRVQTVYEMWVEQECGFDPQLGIQLFPTE